MPGISPGLPPPGAQGGGAPPATVTYGTVTLDTTSSQYVDQQLGTMFEDCVIVSYYEKNRQSYLMPIASSAGFAGLSAAVVQLAGPTLIWVVDWTVSRMGAQPICPDPTPPNSKWVLLRDHWEPGQMEIGGADGQQPWYRMSGTFFYACLQPNPFGTNLDVVFPLPPWLKNNFPRTLPGSFLTKTLTQALIQQVGGIGPGIAYALVGKQLSS